MRLQVLADGATDFEMSPGCGDVEIVSLTADSRCVQPGWLFAALPGARADGKHFVAEAIAKGAAAVLIKSDAAVPVPHRVVLLKAPEPRQAFARLAARFWRQQPRTIVAVTGTSGKTSVADFARQIFDRLGHSAASLGTLGVVREGGATYGTLT